MSRSSRGGGPPAWLIILVAVALVFGGYYVWLGVSNYLRTGGLGVVEATARAVVIASATADRVFSQPSSTLPPSLTPIPECQEFFVSVPQAIVRAAPNTGGEVVTQLAQGTSVCVIGRADENNEWYVIDSNPDTRRIEFAYMHETIILPADPTATPTRTVTPPPTITSVPTLTPSTTPTRTLTPTIDPNATDTLTPTPSDTPLPDDTSTPSFQSA